MAEFPAELEAAITEGAKRLGRALEILGYPNSGRDAPATRSTRSSTSPRASGGSSLLTTCTPKARPPSAAEWT